MNRTIIWLKNDLRLSDNLAIDYAAKNNHEILFLYINDQSIGSASKWFLHYALKAFQKDILQKYNAKLIIKSGDELRILQDLVQKYDINSILWNRIYEPKKIARDIKIKEYFKKSGLEINSFNSSLLFEPNAIKNLSGSFFKVFTPFWKNCLTKIADLSFPTQIPKSLNLITLNKEENFNLEQLNLLPKNPNWAKNWHQIYKISEESAHDMADDFVKNRAQIYKKSRDFPAQNNTSFLSPYLHYGLISPKHLYYKIIPYFNNEDAKCFLSEVGWREFSYHLLYHFPDLPNKNFKAKFDNFPWQNNKDYIKKWQKGQTGFPIIDAGMRELWQTGRMHNRVRMIVASFLTKNLLIDWRIGQEWFWDCLIDADLAANSASWQWVAGSGADAAPYFRIFNPILQSEKFDPKGEYIKKYLPELNDLSNKEIHQPKDRSKYFPEMIDLKESRNKALLLYSGIK
ncbi:DNA photolyase family protein [Rickettsiales bacterium]|nr:DNA photolyase family protein [Rickettsiales bacterium]